MVGRPSGNIVLSATTTMFVGAMIHRDSSECARCLGTDAAHSKFHFGALFAVPGNHHVIGGMRSISR
jgi:hypothetical protein